MRHFGVDEGYIALIHMMYDGQMGTMDGIHFFDITRGVRQGDVLSILLFNAVLDFAFCNWKEKLSEHGWKLRDCDHRDIRTEKLTNVRFADDILILAKSKNELIDMMSLLLPELQNVGLEVNHTKTKLLTTDPSIFKINTSSILYIHDRYFQVLAPHEWHKYLGRYLTFSAHSRSSNELNHRIAAAWSQFHKRKYIFQNSNLSVKLKLKYFHAYVTPCALYGLGALSLGKTAMERLARVQRKMLRLIIGWQRYEGECWRTTMHRMKIKLPNALNTFYVESWDELVLKRKWSWANRILEMNDERWAK